MTRKETILRNKLVIGLNTSYTRLIQWKLEADGNLVYSDNGKIVVAKARNLNIEVDSSEEASI